MKEEVIKFIKLNGWTENEKEETEKEVEQEWEAFSKKGCYGIDVNDSEIVLLDETGDFLHIRNNENSFYTLLGVLIHYNQITTGYNWSNKK